MDVCLVVMSMWGRGAGCVGGWGRTAGGGKMVYITTFVAVLFSPAGLLEGVSLSTSAKLAGTGRGRGVSFRLD